MRRFERNIETEKERWYKERRRETHSNREKDKDRTKLETKREGEREKYRDKNRKTDKERTQYSVLPASLSLFPANISASCL